MKRVMVLHSYHLGLEWTDNITTGILSVFRPLNNEIELYFEYMDTKRNPSNINSSELASFLKSKNKNKSFDVIIVSDNNALQFVNKYGSDLFPDVPVVFCGINNYKPSLTAEIGKVTGVVEKIDHRKNIELMGKLHKNRNHVVIMIDNTPTGKSLKNELLKVISEYNGRLSFEFYQNFNIKNIGEYLSLIDKNSMIYLLTLNSDNKNRFIPSSKAMSILNKNLVIPIYSCWDFYIGKGIIGGAIISGEEQGDKAAELALKIINGYTTSDLPVIKNSQSEYMFDYNIMRKFGIKRKNLPENSIILNSPSSFFHKHQKAVLLFTLFTIFSLIILLLYLFYQSQRQKLLLDINSKLDALVKEKTIELKESNKKLNIIIDTAPCPVFYKDNEGVYQGCNELFAKKIIGSEKNEIIGSKDEHLPNSIADEIPGFPHSMYSDLVQTPGAQFYEAKLKCADNKLRDFYVNKAELRDVHGKTVGIVGIMLDISQRKLYEKELTESRERFKRLMDASFGGILIHEEGVIVDANKDLSELTGYSYEELIGMDGLKLISPEWVDAARAKIFIKKEALYDVDGIKKDGTKYPLEIQSKSIPYGDKIVRVAGLRDITDRINAAKEREKLIAELQEKNEKLKMVSRTDALTGVYNRAHVFEKLTKEILKHQRYMTPLSIIMIDIDHFKTINDTFGHPYGDKVLERISKVFKESIREIDIVGRYGGEEFLIILPNTNLDEGYMLAERIRIKVEKLSWRPKKISITLSCGVAQYGTGSQVDFLKQADDNLYLAKENGRNRVV